MGLLTNKIYLEGNTILGKVGGGSPVSTTFHGTLTCDVGVVSQFHTNFFFIFELTYVCIIIKLNSTLETLKHLWSWATPNMTYE